MRSGLTFCSAAKRQTAQCTTFPECSPWPSRDVTTPLRRAPGRRMRPLLCVASLLIIALILSSGYRPAVSATFRPTPTASPHTTKGKGRAPGIEDLTWLRFRTFTVYHIVKRRRLLVPSQRSNKPDGGQTNVLFPPVPPWFFLNPISYYLAGWFKDSPCSQQRGTPPPRLRNKHLVASLPPPRPPPSAPPIAPASSPPRRETPQQVRRWGRVTNGGSC